VPVSERDSQAREHGRELLGVALGVVTVAAGTFTTSGTDNHHSGPPTHATGGCPARRRTARRAVIWSSSHVPLLVLRAGPGERDALLSTGHPFFAPRAGGDRIGVRLTGDTDWEEIGELVTGSYRRLAPKKLTALLG
jgi:hypothetical protein